MPHRLDQIARHAREFEQLGICILVSGPMISCTSPPEQKVAAGAGDNDDLNVIFFF